MTTNPWMRWTAAAAVAFVMAASSSLACDKNAQAADEKDPKSVAANAEEKGCDKPCCPKKADPTAKNAVAPVAVPAAHVAGVPAADAPCTAKAGDGTSCPKKAAMVAKAEPAKDAPKADPAPASGANR